MKKSAHHLKPGKLYATQEWFWPVFPSKEKIAARPSTGGAFLAPLTAVFWATYWSEYLKCTVSYVEPDSVFMVLGVEGEFVEVLFAEILGWIWIPDWAEKNIRRERLRAT